MKHTNSSDSEDTEEFNREKMHFLLQALDEFTRSETWDEAKQVVEAHHELLTEEADALLAALIARQKDQQAVQILQEHRHILVRCRNEGIDAAFSERVPVDEFSQLDVDPVLWMRLQSANSYDALMHLLFEYPELMSAIKKRMAQVLGAAEIRIVNAIEAFLNADSWFAVKVVIQSHPELLGLDADIWLAQYAAFVEAQGDVEIAAILAERRWLLTRCRLESVDVVFRERLMPPDGVRREMPAETMSQHLMLV